MSRIREVLTVLVGSAVLAQCEAVSPSELSTPGSKTRVAMPQAVTDFRASDATDSSATVSFTEVDDGMQHPASYAIRYGVAPMTWDQASSSISSRTCPYPLTGTSIGSRRSCVVEGLAPKTSYEFQLVPFRSSTTGDTTVGPLTTAAPITTLAEVALVSVSPTTATLVAGQTVQLTAAVFDADGLVLTRPIDWSSDDTTRAVVNALGGVISRGPGTVTITARSGERSGSSVITITPAPTSPARVSNLAATATSDTSVTLSFTEVTDGTGLPATYDIRFAPTPMSFASGTDVSRGTCSMPAAGTAIGASRTCTVLGLRGLTNYGFALVSFRGTWGGNNAVYGPISNQATVSTPTRVSTVTVTPAPVSMTVGQTTQLNAQIRDAGGTLLPGRVVTWSTSTPNVAQVNSSGLVTAAGGGSATITALSEGTTGQSQITVSFPPPPPVATVTVAPTPASLTVGQTTQLIATLRDAGGNILSGRTVTWSTNDGSIASVNTGGVVGGVGAGTTAITVTSEGRTGQAQINVAAAFVPVASVTVTPGTVTVGAGLTTQLVATTRDANGNVLNGRTVTWSSVSNAIARVSASGLVTGASGGTTTITATSEGIPGTSSVTVTAPVTSVTLSPSSLNLQTGQTMQLSAALRDGAGNVLTGRTITWSSTASGVASVSNGLVTANATGGATVSATSEGVPGNASVTVSAPVPPNQSIVWFSDWRTATGNSTTALRDGGKWTDELCTRDAANVVSTSGLDFPSGMANVFRSEYANFPGSGICRMMRVSGRWPAPAVGQSIYFRLYYRNAAPNGADFGQAHPVQATNITWEWKIKTPSGGRSSLEWIFPGQLYPDTHYDVEVNTNQTYRLEWRMQRVSNTTCKVDLRVYNSANSLVFDRNSFRTESFGGSNIPLATRDPDLSCGGPDDLRTMEVGNNDPNTTIGPGVYVYWGGAAVSLSDWVGPYTPTGG